MDVEQLLLVIDAEGAAELALAEEVVERDTRTYGDTRPELLPSLATMIQSGDEMLVMGQSIIAQCSLVA